MNNAQYRAGLGVPSLGSHKELRMVDGKLVAVEIPNDMDDIGYDDWLEMREQGEVSQ